MEYCHNIDTDLLITDFAWYEKEKEHIESLLDFDSLCNVHSILYVLPHSMFMPVLSAKT
jgi:hypothetical protein